jgi:hypothetical protein
VTGRQKTVSRHSSNAAPEADLASRGQKTPGIARQFIILPEKLRSPRPGLVSRGTLKNFPSERSMILAPGRNLRLLRRDDRRVRCLQHQSVNSVTFPLKIGKHASIKFARAGEFHPHRINKMTIDDDFVMEVGAGG